jgi:hypothetical protein
VDSRARRCLRRAALRRVDVTQPWSLPGYDVQVLLGYGGAGEVWRAREVDTGELVALKRLRRDADPVAVDALRREAAVLASLDTPYVVRLRRVVGEGADAVLVLDLAAGGSLASLLTRRGVLDAGEVVTIAAPIAQALAAAHARGIVHGDVTPSNLLFRSDGMPLLADLGLARLGGADDALGGTAEYLDPVVAAGGDPTPASDVWALAAVCHHLLAGSPPHEGEAVDDVLAAARDGGRAPLGLLAPTAPRPLVDAVEAALAPDPAHRPDAAAFASALRRAHAAAPVRFDGADTAASAVARATHAVPRHAAEPPLPLQRALPRWLVPAALAVVLLASAAALGWWLGRGPEPAAAAAPLTKPGVTDAPRPVTPSPTAPRDDDVDWAGVLDMLDATRAAAFATPDTALLEDVYAPGASGLAVDRALVEELAAAGHRAEGVRHDVRAVDELEVSAASARLRVVDRLGGYVVRDSAGAVVQRSATRPDAAYVVELARTADGWRLVTVNAA